MAKKSKSKTMKNTSKKVETVVAEEVVETPQVTMKQKSPPKQKAGAKKTKKSKSPPKVEHTETEVLMTEATEGNTEVEPQTGAGKKRVRSFKVHLPGHEGYAGRFTGLTPYQAANKALSKYYRETTKPKKQIQFSIRESTRGSKRSVYTYDGKREKLKTPVQYSIKDGRVITKKFKNRLRKIKKNELEALNSN